MASKNIYIIEKALPQYPYKSYCMEDMSLNTDIDYAHTFNDLIEMSKYFDKHNLYHSKDITIERARTYIRKI